MEFLCVTALASVRYFATIEDWSFGDLRAQDGLSRCKPCEPMRTPQCLRFTRGRNDTFAPDFCVIQSANRRAHRVERLTPNVTSREESRPSALSQFSDEFAEVWFWAMADLRRRSSFAICKIY